jgi:hypothetical protein
MFMYEMLASMMVHAGNAGVPEFVKALEEDLRPVFLPGETMKHFPITLTADTAYEESEEFYVDYSMPDGFKVARSRGIIFNDDPTGGVPIIANRSWNTTGSVLRDPNRRARLTSLPPSNARSCNRKVSNIIIGISACFRLTISKASCAIHSGISTFLLSSTTTQIAMISPGACNSFGPTCS